jgi:hypothetical protein
MKPVYKNEKKSFVNPRVFSIFAESKTPRVISI